MGGAVAASVARDSQIGALVLWAAVARPAALRTLAGRTSKPIPESAGARDYSGHSVSALFIESVSKVDPLDSLRPGGPNPRTDGNVWISSPGAAAPVVAQLKWIDADFAVFVQGDQGFGALGRNDRPYRPRMPGQRVDAGQALVFAASGRGHREPGCIAAAGVADRQ